LFSTLVDQSKNWCAGKNWLWRLPVLAWFGLLLVRHVSDAGYTSVIGPLNLGIHELGHLIFGWGPQFLAVAGGTIAQLAAPVFGLWNFYRQDDFFAMALSFGWLSTNLFDVAHYQADARAMALDLVSPFGGGDTVIHDWNYMFFHTGLLNFDTLIAGFTRLLAVAAMLVCLACGGWLLAQMMISPQPNNESKI
jgi:hypothetical protein